MGLRIQEPPPTPRLPAVATVMCELIPSEPFERPRHAISLWRLRKSTIWFVIIPVVLVSHAYISHTHTGTRPQHIPKSAAEPSEMSRCDIVHELLHFNDFIPASRARVPVCQRTFRTFARSRARALAQCKRHTRRDTTVNQSASLVGFVVVGIVCAATIWQKVGTIQTAIAHMDRIYAHTHTLC